MYIEQCKSNQLESFFACSLGLVAATYFPSIMVLAMLQRVISTIIFINFSRPEIKVATLKLSTLNSTQINELITETCIR